MTTKLALLVDECVPTSLAEAIRDCSGISGYERIDNSHELGNCGTPDERLMNYAAQTGKILITIEGRLDEKKFPICTHPGIIVMSGSRALQKADLFSKFMQSGERKNAKHAVTYLRVSGSIIRTKNTGGSIEDIPLNL